MRRCGNEVLCEEVVVPASPPWRSARRCRGVTGRLRSVVVASVSNLVKYRRVVSDRNSETASGHRWSDEMRVVCSVDQREIPRTRSGPACRSNTVSQQRAMDYECIERPLLVSRITTLSSSWSRHSSSTNGHSSGPGTLMRDGRAHVDGAEDFVERTMRMESQMAD
jgi:hypothetical protein